MLPPSLSPAPASGTVPAAGGNKQSDVSDGTFPPHKGAAGCLHPVSGHPPLALSTPQPCARSLHPQPPCTGHLPPMEERSSSGSHRDALDGCPLPARLPSPCPAAARLASPAGSTAVSLQGDFPGNIPPSQVWHRVPTRPTSSLSRRLVNGKEQSRPSAVPAGHLLPFSTWQHRSWRSFLLCPPTRGRTVTSCLQPCQQPPRASQEPGAEEPLPAGPGHGPQDSWVPAWPPQCRPHRGGDVTRAGRGGPDCCLCARYRDRDGSSHEVREKQPSSVRGDPRSGVHGLGGGFKESPQTPAPLLGQLFHGGPPRSRVPPRSQPADAPSRLPALFVSPGPTPAPRPR